MGKPRLIILIRHGQSEGNKNRDIHQTIPDHRVKLTPEGWQQAYDAGRRLRALLRADDTLQVFTSPYRRTRETTEAILATLTSDEPEPSPFKRSHIKVYEEPRLREQDFGNFQPCSAEMERMWQERADYGHFFYRIPNGESAADAYDRVSGFNESLWRQFGDSDFASVCVLVTHGLMSRVFLMKWYHFSVEYFEDLRNINHCEFLIMRKNADSGKYILETKLRTWSELKRERALQQAKAKDKDKDKDKEKEKEKEKDKDKDKDAAAKEARGENNETSKDSLKLERAFNGFSAAAATATTAITAAATTSSYPLSTEPCRRWGGCPNGCNHDKNFKIRQTLADLVKSDSTTSSGGSSHVNGSGNGSGSGSGSGSGTGSPASTPSSGTVINGNGTIASRRPANWRLQSHSPAQDNNANGTREGNGTAEDPSASVPGPLIEIDVIRATEEVVSSPDGTPSFISVEDRLRGHLRSPGEPPLPQQLVHVGRDFGGTYSGHSSVVDSEADSSSDEDGRRRVARQKRKQLQTSSSVAAGGRMSEIKLLAVPPNMLPSAAGTGSGKGNSADSGSGHAHPHPHPHGHTHGHAHGSSSNGGDGGSSSRARANRLGDQPASSDSEHERDHDQERAPSAASSVGCGDENELVRMSTAEIRSAEEEDKSICGSVY